MVDPEVVLLYLAVNPDNSCYHYVIDISHVIPSSVDLDKTQRPYEARKSYNGFYIHLIII